MKYNNYIDSKYVYMPKETNKEFNTYHTFVVQVKQRDKLKNYLKRNGVDSTIHYPVPIHLQKCSIKLGYKKGDFLTTESQAKEILSLPINQFLQNKEIVKISKLINNFYKIF